MNKFAFINHYLDTKLASEQLQYAPRLDNLAKGALKSLIAELPPYRYMTIAPVISSMGAQASGIGVACPLLPEHFVTLPQNTVFEKILTAAKIGERFGANVIGLGGFTSIFGNGGRDIAQSINAAVTSGNTYTAALAIQGLIKAAGLMGLRINECKTAIVGATGDIGSICTKLLAKQTGQLILAARNEKRLEEFAAYVSRISSIPVSIEKYTADAVRNADLVLTATSALTTIIEPEDLKQGAVVCDVAYPANVSSQTAKRRDDVLAFEGGLARWPHYNSVIEQEKLQEFSPPGTIHGCLAETMILALEGKYLNFSIGRGYITDEKIQEITLLAQKHGFELAPFSCGGKLYSEEDIMRIRSKAMSAKRETV